MFIQSKFQQRLMMYSFILYMISIPLTVFFSYFISRDIIYRQVEKANNHMAKEAAINMEMILEDILDVTNIMSSDERLCNLASRLGKSAFDEFVVWREMSAYFLSVLDSYEMIDMISVVGTEKVHYVTSAPPSTGIGRIALEETAASLNEKILLAKESPPLTSGVYYVEVDGKMSIYKHLMDEGNDELYIAVIIKKPIEQSPQMLGQYVYVYGNEMIINMGYDTERESQFRKTIIEGQKQESYADTTEFGEVFLRFNKPLSMCDLHLAYFVDIQHIQKEIEGIRNSVIVAAVLSFAVIMLLSLVLSSRLYKNIALLKNQMSKTDFHEINNPEKFPETGKNGSKRLKLPFMVKTLMYYLQTAAVPIIIISFIAYVQTLSIIEGKVGLEIRNSVILLSDKMNNTLESYSTSGFMLSINRTFQELLKRDSNGKIPGALTADEKLSLTKLLINNQMRKGNLDNINVYDNLYNLYYSLELGFAPLQRKPSEFDFNFLNDNTPDKKWEVNLMNGFNSHFIHVGIRIRNIATFEPLGYLFVEFGGDYLKTMLKTFSDENNTYIFILDQYQNTIYMSDNIPNGGDDFDVAHFNQSSEGIRLLTIGSEEYFLSTADIEAVGWRIAALTPMSYYTHNKEQILMGNLIILLCSLVLVLFASYSLSRMMSKSVSLMLDRFVKVQNGIFEKVKIGHTRDEIDELGMQYNIMVERIQNLLNEVYNAKNEMAEVELKLRESQFNALQSQINPHFLYNTLETIHFMILLGDKNAIKMVQLLGDLFRKGIGKGERFVQVRQELEHIRLYIEIQQFRYPEKFSVEIEIDEEILSLYTIKFLLQPILENTIYHGLELIESDGMVKIIGDIIDNKLIMRIVDNGQGMDSKKLNELIAKLDGKIESKSIGLKNVHERIQLYFGMEYGLRITSEYGSGTEVVITLPILYERLE